MPGLEPRVRRRRPLEAARPVTPWTWVRRAAGRLAASQHLVPPLLLLGSCAGERVDDGVPRAELPRKLLSRLDELEGELREVAGDAPWAARYEHADGERILRLWMAPRGGFAWFTCVGGRLVEQGTGSIEERGDRLLLASPSGRGLPSTGPSTLLLGPEMVARRWDERLYLLRADRQVDFAAHVVWREVPGGANFLLRRGDAASPVERVDFFDVWGRGPEWLRGAFQRLPLRARVVEILSEVPDEEGARYRVRVDRGGEGGLFVGLALQPIVAGRGNAGVVVASMPEQAEVELLCENGDPRPRIGWLLGRPRLDLFHFLEGFQSAPEVEERIANIELELAALRSESPGEHPWAGVHGFGDGLFVAASLYLAPEQGFAFSHSSDISIAHETYGSVHWEEPWLTLDPARPDEFDCYLAMDRRLRAVQWGGRHYLLPADVCIAFAQDAAAGAEPRQGLRSHHYAMRREDEDLPLPSFAELPAWLRELADRPPIEASIVEIFPSPSTEGWRKTRVRLDAGRRRGLCLGMELRISGRDWGLPGPVVELEDASAVVELSHRVETAPPEVGWTLVRDVER